MRLRSLTPPAIAALIEDEIVPGLARHARPAGLRQTVLFTAHLLCEVSP